MALLVTLAAAPTAAAQAQLPPSLDQAEKDAAAWLAGRMVPNDTVPAPSPDRRRLLLSYDVPKDDPAYRYIYGRSFIYDDALGAIALTMLGRYRDAEFLLNGLARLVRPDGSLWFAYNTQNDWPSDGDNGGAIIRTGAVAWVGYALTCYLSVRQREQAAFAAVDVLGRRYRQTAEAVARWVVSRQVTDAADPRDGLVTGGAGSTTVTVGANGAAPSEAWNGNPLRWVSTEHNIDAWFFLRDLGRVTGTASWTGAADSVRAGLLRLWSPGDGQFFQGVLESGRVDRSLPLDCATWGALFLTAIGRTADAERSLSVIDERFGATTAGVRGYRPYGPERVYADARVGAFYFPSAPAKQWKELPFVWGEGSAGAAAALARSGRRDAAAAALTSLLPMQTNGGFRYATQAVAFQFTDYPSVATTAWFVIAVEMLRGNPAADLFWGR